MFLIRCAECLVLYFIVCCKIFEILLKYIWRGNGPTQSEQEECTNYYISLNSKFYLFSFLFLTFFGAKQSIVTFSLKMIVQLVLKNQNDWNLEKWCLSRPKAESKEFELQLKFKFIASRLMPALNWNRFLADLRLGN